MTKKPVFDTAFDMSKEMGIDVQKAAVDSVCRAAIRRVAEVAADGRKRREDWKGFAP